MINLNADLTFKNEKFCSKGNLYHNYFYKNANGFLNMTFLEDNRLKNFNSEDEKITNHLPDKKLSEIFGHAASDTLFLRNDGDRKTIELYKLTTKEHLMNIVNTIDIITYQPYKNYVIYTLKDIPTIYFETYEGVRKRFEITNIDFILDLRWQMMVYGSKLQIWTSQKKVMVKDLENELQTGLLDPLHLYNDTELVKCNDVTGSYDFIYQCDNQRLGSVLTNFSYQEFLDAIEGRRKDANGVVASLSDQN